MAGAAAWWAGADGRGSATISLAPGHSIKISSVLEKIAALNALSMQGALSAAKGAWSRVWGRVDPIDVEYFGSREIYSRYEAAQMSKYWNEADQLVLDQLARDRTKYCRLLDGEETARALSAWLCETASVSDHVYRWIDPIEIESCMGGTFESKIEDGGARRGFKALSVNPRLWFNRRKIQMRVPVDTVMRTNIQCVQYTVMPRDIVGKNERICDPKEARHAVEAEIRVPDGTPIPQGTDFTVLEGARISRDIVKALSARYRITWAGC